MAVDIDYIRDVYFTFDKPVPYDLKCGYTLYVQPIKLKDSMIFSTSYGILDIDKNLSTEVEVIQMSYLQYLSERVFVALESSKQQLVNICLLCLGFTIPEIIQDDKGKYLLVNIARKEDTGEYYPEFFITAKEFDDIKRIILYQNLPNFDDEYVNPELKENMAEYDQLKNKDIVMPSLERRIAIISSHCGISKQEQIEMTMRSHNILFNEVVGEVEFMSKRAMYMYAGKGEDIQWIFQKTRGKFDEYITSVEKFNKSAGGDGVLSHSTKQLGENYISKYNDFIGG